MLALDVVQAAFGDCLIVRFETKGSRRMIVVDGGPSGTYVANLRPRLIELARATAGEAWPQIDLAVLSHIDNDHVKGLLDLFVELEDDLNNAPAPDGVRPPPVKELWHNAFSVSAGGADIAPRIREALDTAANVAPQLRMLTGTLEGVGEGDALKVAAMALGIPINREFGGGSILVDGSHTIHMDGMRLDVAGPSTAILERLRTEWLTWLKAHEHAIAGGPSVAAIAADSALPNLSSIVVLLRAGGRSMLLTGDGRGDQIVAGLQERRLLKPGGVIHVDLLKVPHHGSSRNATADLFRTVTADRYVISANGRYGNPDLECLLSLVDAAGGRPIELFCTNETESLRDLVKQRPPKSSGYDLTIMPADEHAHTIVIN